MREKRKKCGNLGTLFGIIVVVIVLPAGTHVRAQAAGSVQPNPSIAVATLLDTTSSDWHNSSQLTVVIPCAGLGTRLGLPYPKEMHMVGANTALIDLSLRHLAPYAAQIRSVVIILEPSKRLLVDYLGKWRDALPIHFCYFDQRHYEWAGSILSAHALFGERNLVLLPDSFLVPAPGLPLVPTVLDLLTRHGVAFGFLPESRAERLHALGALAVTADGEVEAFCDKPAAGFERYNGFWGCFGFRRANAEAVLRAMMASIAREPVSVEDFGASAAAFQLKEYLDLGTWANLHRAVAEKLFSSGDPRNTSDPTLPRP